MKNAFLQRWKFSSLKLIFSMYKVILTDIESRKGFDIYNIFKKKINCELILCSTKKISSFFTFLFDETIYFLDTTSNYTFNESLLTIINKYETDKLIYFPVSDQCNLLLYHFVNKYPSKKILYLLPEIEAYSLCINKDNFEKFCHTNNFLTPRKYEYEEVRADNFTNYPLIVKPTIGTGSKGIFFIESKEDLEKLEKINLRNHLIQERIQSIEVLGAFFLFHKGELVAYYGHRRLRTSPATGGVTVCSITDYNEDLKEIGTKLLKKLDFNGIAMIEFLYDEKDKSYKIIELNPRAWGSYLLGEFIGADFTEKYIKILKGEDVSQNNIKIGDFYIKWLIPYEIINLLKRRVSFSEFFRQKNTCFINITYSSAFKSFLFFVYNSFNLKYLFSKLTR